MLRKSLARDTLLGSTAPPHKFSMAVVNDNSLHRNHHEVEGNHSHHHTKEVADGGPWFQYVSSMAHSRHHIKWYYSMWYYIYICVYNTYIHIYIYINWCPWGFHDFRGKATGHLHQHPVMRQSVNSISLRRSRGRVLKHLIIPRCSTFSPHPPKNIHLSDTWVCLKLGYPEIKRFKIMFPIEKY